MFRIVILFAAVGVVADAVNLANAPDGANALRRTGQLLSGSLILTLFLCLRHCRPRDALTAAVVSGMATFSTLAGWAMLRHRPTAAAVGVIATVGFAGIGLKFRDGTPARC